MKTKIKKRGKIKKNGTPQEGGEGGRSLPGARVIMKTERSKLARKPFLQL